MGSNHLFERLDERYHSMFIGLLNNEPAAMVDAVRAASATVVALRRKDGTRSLLGRRTFIHDDQREVAKNKAALQRREAAWLAMRKNSSVKTFFSLINEWRKKSISYLQANVSSRLWKCEKCSRYFLAKNDRKWRRYCSPRCAWGTTAKAAVYKKRKAKKEEKLRRARLAIRSWNGTGDWKAWTASRARLSRKFLTQVANRGDLKAPT